MSFRRIAAVFELEGLCMRDKSVLLALAHFENEKTGRCLPSVATIAKTTGCSAKTVNTALLALQRRGLIEYKKSLGRNTNNYHIKIAIPFKVSDKVSPSDGNANPVCATGLDVVGNTARPRGFNPVNLPANPVNLPANPVNPTDKPRSNIEKNQEPPPPSEASHTARVHACARVREGTPAGAGLAAGVKLVPTFDEAIPDSTPPAWKPWRRIVGAARHSSRNLRVEGFDGLLAIAKDAGRDEAWLLDHLAVLAESGWRDYDGRREAVTIADRIDYLRSVIASEAAGEVVPPGE